MKYLSIMRSLFQLDQIPLHLISPQIFIKRKSLIPNIALFDFSLVRNLIRTYFSNNNQP